MRGRGGYRLRDAWHEGSESRCVWYSLSVLAEADTFHQHLPRSKLLKLQFLGAVLTGQILPSLRQKDRLSLLCKHTHAHDLFSSGSIDSSPDSSLLSHPQGPRILHSSSTEGDGSLEANLCAPGMHPGVPTGERWALLYAAELGRERRQFITRKKLWSPRASSDGAQSMSALLIPDAPGETTVS